MTAPADAATVLKPCPFCGGPGRASNRRNDDFMNARWSVFCKGPVECGAEMGYYDTKAEAIAAWNRRSPTPPQVAGATSDEVEGLQRRARLLLAFPALGEGERPMLDLIRDFSAAFRRLSQPAHTSAPTPEFCEHCDYDHSVGPKCREAQREEAPEDAGLLERANGWAGVYEKYYVDGAMTAKLIRDLASRIEALTGKEVDRG